jgi:hypothetical protein
VSTMLLPPQPPACLERPAPSTQKGGTLLAVNVMDPETHERRRCSPDGYRPEFCQSCGAGRLHVHDYVQRHVLSDADLAVVVVVRYLGCAATWRVLPGFLPRYVRRRWATVEAVTLGPPPPRSAPEISARTRARWRYRLGCAIGEALRTLDSASPLGLAVRSSTDRRALVVVLAAMISAAPGRRLAVVAAVIHAAVPGVRLM